MSFPCTKCGACCRRVGLMAKDFPYATAEAPRCTKLADDNTCTIYEERPLVCRIDHIVQLLHPTARAGFYTFYASLCNEAQEQDGMPESYRVKIDAG